MAKTQTFGDKVKKRKGDTRIHVKVVGSFMTEEGNLRFKERFIAVDDVNVLENIEVNII